MVNAETGASIKLAVNPSTEESESSSGKDTVTVEGDPAEGPVEPSASRTNAVVAAPEDLQTSTILLNTSLLLIMKLKQSLKWLHVRF